MAKTSSISSSKWQRSLTVLFTFVTVVLVIACLYFARAVLIPVAVAILLTFLLSPLVTTLQRRGLRRVPSVLVVVTLAGIVLAGFGWLVAAQVKSLAADLPSHEENIRAKLADLRGLSQGGAFDKASTTIKDLAKDFKKDETPPAAGEKKTLPVPPVPVVVQKEEEALSGLDQIAAVVGPALSPLADAGLVIVLVIFMLVSREDLRNRLIRLVGQGHITLTTKALDDAGQRISRYLLMQLIINGTFGIAIGVGLFFIGVPYALLWGFLAGVLRYIPYLGPWLAALLPLGTSLITFEGWMPLLLVVGLFLACELVSNMIMEPMLYGRGIGVSEAALLVAVAFWTWVWGPVGLIMAAPLTVCLVVLGKYVPALHFFDVLLGDKPALSADVRYFQRLLARDQDEAADVAEAELKTGSLEMVYDNVLLPALTAARSDEEYDRLTEEETQFIFHSTREIADELKLIADKKGEKETKSADEPTAAKEATSAVAPTAEAQAMVQVVGCPARTEADEIAVQMLHHLMTPAGVEIEVAPYEMLASEVMALVENKETTVICVTALPPGGLAHTRYLCLRLRARFPELKILVARWGLRHDLEKNREQLLAAGADYFSTTLQETRGQLIECANVVRHLTPPEIIAEQTERKTKAEAAVSA